MKNKDKLNEMFNKAIRKKTVLSVQLKDPSPKYSFGDDYVKRKSSKLVIEFASYEDYEKWLEDDEDKTRCEAYIDFLKDERECYQKLATKCLKDYERTKDPRWLHAVETNMTRADLIGHILSHFGTDSFGGY